MVKRLLYTASFFLFFLSFVGTIHAQNVRVTPTSTLVEEELDEATDSAALAVSPQPSPRVDFTADSEETVEPLKMLLDQQELGSFLPFNPIKYAIHASVEAGVPPNTIVLLIMLPAVAALIAAARHLVGIRGFGIFLPAALSVVFIAIGPVTGIILFLIIVGISALSRIFFKRLKIKLQYLPRMAMTLLFVVMGVLLLLFAAPVIRQPDLTNVSIFPVLILVLLAEEFSKIQMGKSARTAINLTTETLILALVSFIFLTLESVQRIALLRPEAFLFSVVVIDYFLGKFVGLRFIEFWRFRKLISN